jgi:hypothetical protein
MADLAEAARFLALLAGNDPVSFQTFADSDGGGSVARILHGTLAGLIALAATCAALLAGGLPA